MGNCVSENSCEDGSWSSEIRKQIYKVIPKNFTTDKPNFETVLVPVHVIDERNKTITDPVILIRNGVIGQAQMIHTPFGRRQLVYADYTASGRFLGPVEDFFAEKIAPFYANTHTEASATGAQTTVLREEARFIIAQSVKAPAKKYATLFVGTGCTGALEKMINVLGIMLPKYADKKWKLSKRISEKERPVVFIGPFEHHSNELSWRESIAIVVVIPEDKDGCPNMKILEKKLIMYKKHRMKIGSFSAGSNVTGICIDTKAVTLLLHKYAALAFFDYAGCGAYVSINVDGNGQDESMDAIFMSPHKFIGGPGCTGVLVAKREIFEGMYGVETKTPTFPGGGTVAFVGPYDQDYEKTVEAREDAGTPGIVQAIRTGLVFQVKEMVGSERIERIERHHCEMVFKMLSRNPNISLTGCNRKAYFDSKRRVPIFSFNIVSPFRPEFDIVRMVQVQIPANASERNIMPSASSHSIMMVPNHGPMKTRTKEESENERSEVQERRASIRMSINSAVNFSSSYTASKASIPEKFASASNLILHPTFIVCILNDLYGIQARAGCSCTGPYGHRLFNMSERGNELAVALRELTRRGYHAFKPGWARVNFNYFISDEEMKFICDAIIQVSRHGWKLLPFYQQEASSGLYIHRAEPVTNKHEKHPSKVHMISLADFSLSEANYPKKTASVESSKCAQRTSRDFKNVLKEAEMIYCAAENQLQVLLNTSKTRPVEISTFTEPLPSDIGLDKIWWATPRDVMYNLKQHNRVPGRSLVRDQIKKVPSPVIGIDDVEIITRQGTNTRRGSMLKTDEALLHSAEILSKTPIQTMQHALLPSFRTSGMDRDTLYGSVFMAESPNLRSRG